VPAWRARRAVAWGATTLSIRATRAGAAKRVRSANNVFEVLFLKIILKKMLKLKNRPIDGRQTILLLDLTLFLARL
jgi:hypothetical protein